MLRAYNSHSQNHKFLPSKLTNHDPAHWLPAHGSTQQVTGGHWRSLEVTRGHLQEREREKEREERETKKKKGNRDQRKIIKNFTKATDISMFLESDPPPTSGSKI